MIFRRKTIMWLRLCMMAIATSIIAGCGAAVPKINEAWERDYPGDPNPPNDPTPPISASGQIEYEVKQNIYCELRKAVQFADSYRLKNNTGPRETTTKLLPDDWGAVISLSFQVDENSTLTPGLSLITPLLNQQSRSFGIGGTLSSTTTRTDKFNSFFTIGYLRDNSRRTINKICDDQNEDPFRKGLNIEPARSSLLVEGLGLRSWLLDALLVNKGIPSYGTPSTPHLSSTVGTGRSSKSGSDKDPTLSATGQDTISIEIEFVIVSNGNVTPTWKLIRVAANTSGTLFATGRVRTHDLILTIGPRGLQTDNANLALQIGQAVAAANRVSLSQP